MRSELPVSAGARRRRTALLAALATAAATALVPIMLASPTSAAPQTEAIPLATIGPAPVSGTLPNQVGWSVNVGTWNTAGQGYAITTGDSPQTWTFDKPVAVRFGIGGLNLAGECVQVPVGTVAETIAPEHTYDAGTRQVCENGTSPTAVSTFVLAGPVTTLSLVVVGGTGSAGRGPTFIEVTYDLPVATINGPTNGATYPYGGAGTIDVSCTDGAPPVTPTVTLDRGPAAPGDSLLTLAPGTHTIVLTCTDASGATATATSTFTVQQPPPPTLATTTTATTTPSSGGAPIADDVERIFGPDRVGTAIAVSQASFDTDAAGAVVLARRDDFPDALAGTPFAAFVHGPMLLSSTAALEPEVEHEIARVLPDGGTVYLLGGEVALGPNVANRLAGLGYAVHRIAGENRFATAVAIAQQLGSPATVLEASGLDFPDAVSSGAAAIGAGAAVLLTDGASQSAATAGYLAAHPTATRFAVGGPAATADPSATGLVGADRFATSALVAARFFPTPTIVGVASGRAFPDALTGGVHVGVLGGPMLLTEPGDLPAPIADYLHANTRAIDRAIIYGGVFAVAENVEVALGNAIV